MTARFDGKVAVITGAAGGLGRLFCESLCRRGAEVWAWDLNPEGLAQLEAEAKVQGWSLHTAEVDVTKPAQIKKALDAILAERRRIELFFNNAGVGIRGGFRKMEAGAIKKIVDVNLNGVLNGTQAALSHMEAMGGGAIVNIASVAGFLPAPYLSLYSATKHAVVGFTRAVREELRLECSNTRLVLVAPGFVDTPMIGAEQGLNFPDWLRWAVAKPQGVVDEVLEALSRGQDEIFPTWNGRLILRLYRLFPRTTQRSSKMLLAKRFKDILFNRYTA